MAKCRKCKRLLKNPKHILEGIGPVCKRREGLTTIRSIKRNDGDTDSIFPYQGGPVWIERKTAKTWTVVPGVGELLADKQHPASGVRTNVPRQVYDHSPTGYNFGYGGSGPADWALNILLLFCEIPKSAHSLHQKFKREFVAVGGQEQERLEIPQEDIIRFIIDNGCKVKPGLSLSLF